MDARDAKYGPRLSMTLCRVSSEDEAHRADVLRMHARHSAGWQSSKHCTYPQELLFHFDGQVYVEYIRVLAHESKIASCIDVCVADARDAELASGVCGACETAAYTRLGHVRFATNAQSRYRARELKTVNVQRRCVYLKLLLRRPHANAYNVFGQVGLIALSAHGTVLRALNAWTGCTLAIRVGEYVEAALEEMLPLTVARTHGVAATATTHDTNNGDDDGDSSRHRDDCDGDGDGAVATPRRRDTSDKSSGDSAIATDRAQPCDSPSPSSSSSSSSSASRALSRRIAELRAMKQRAVLDEDYDVADALKTQLALLDTAHTQLRELEAAKEAAVAAEDYRRAKELKLTIDGLLRLGYQSPAPQGVPQTTTATVNAPPPPPPPPSSSSSLRPPTPSRGAFVADNNNNDNNDNNDDDNNNNDAGDAVAGTAVAHDAQVVRGKGYYDVTAMLRRDGGVAHDDAPVTPAAASPPTTTTTTPTPPAAAAAAAATVTLQGDGAAWERAFNRVIVDLAGEQQQQQATTTTMHTLPLPDARIAELERYTRTFGRYATACLFGRRATLREAVLRAAVSPAGFAALCRHVAAATVAEELLAYVATRGCGVGDAVASVVFASCHVVLALLRGDGGDDRDGGDALAAAPPPSQLTAALMRLLPELVARLGDANRRIRDRVVDVVVALAHSSLGAWPVVQALAIDAAPPRRTSSAAATSSSTASSAVSGHNTGPATPTLSTRALLTRLDVLTTLVDDGTLRAHDEATWSRLLLDAQVRPGLQHAHADVRAAAARLFAHAAKHMPHGACAALLEQLKPAQRAMVQQHMRAVALQGSSRDDGAVAAAARQHRNGDDGDDDDKDARNDMEAVSMSVHDMRLPTLRAADGRAHDDDDHTTERRHHHDDDGGDDRAHEHDAAAADGRDSADADAERALHTCQFCHEYRPDFSEASLDVHYVRACPMLCPCPLCDQVTEICMLQQHLVSECEGRALVRECPRCREAVQAEDLKSHVAAQTCIKAVATHSVCPLCHARFRAGVEGWRRHLATAPGCVNNPRKYDGTGPYERA